MAVIVTMPQSPAPAACPACGKDGVFVSALPGAAYLLPPGHTDLGGRTMLCPWPRIYAAPAGHGSEEER